jgi:hypothetical protein
MQKKKSEIKNYEKKILSTNLYIYFNIKKRHFK